MIDIHSHIIYDIDDGCSSIEESVETIRKLKELGFNSIVLTPHFISGSDYESSNAEKLDKINNIKETLNSQNINIDLFIGNEIFVSNDIKSLLESNKISTLGNSKNLLIELSMDEYKKEYDDILHTLKLYGYKIIIAHPERYLYFQNDYEKIKDFYNDGVFFQCNYESIIKKYGSKAKKLFEFLLKNDMVDFLGTDVHHQNSSLFKKFELCKKKIIKIIGYEKFELLSMENIKTIIK